MRSEYLDTSSLGSAGPPMLRFPLEASPQFQDCAPLADLCKEPSRPTFVQPGSLEYSKLSADAADAICAIWQPVVSLGTREAVWRYVCKPPISLADHCKEWRRPGIVQRGSYDHRELGAGALDAVCAVWQPAVSS